MARVILLDQYAGLGGGQRILLDLARAFRSAGHGVQVMIPGQGAAEKTLRDEGFPILNLPLPQMTPGRKTLREELTYPFYARRAAAAVVSAIADEGGDLLYANGPRCFLPAVLAARKTGIRVVCALHLIFRRGREHRLIQWCFRQKEVKRVIFCSDAVAEPFRRYCGEKAVKVVYWVSPPFLAEPANRAACREKFDLASDNVAVGVLGRISKTKGQRVFLEALEPLLSAYPNLKLFVAGAADFEDPGEEGTIRSLASASPDPSRIVVTGTMVESLPFLDAMDLLVVPSQWDEPFGLVALEGMARGLPVVVTRSGGLQEIVEDTLTGFHAGKDVQSIRAAVEPLVGDPTLRGLMGAAGRQRVETMFHPQRQLAEILRACFE